MRIHNLIKKLTLLVISAISSLTYAGHHSNYSTPGCPNCTEEVLFAPPCSNCRIQTIIAENERVLFEELAAAGVQIIQVGDQVKIILPVDCFFRLQNNRQIIRSRIPLMHSVVKFLRNCGNVPIVVSAHTDNVGTDEDKFRRTAQQADTVAAYLWAEGIPYGNITVIGCGDTKPVSSNKTVQGSADNRRIEITTKLY